VCEQGWLIIINPSVLLHYATQSTFPYPREGVTGFVILIELS